MLVRICQACKSKVPEGARFCPSCGKEVISSPSQGKQRVPEPAVKKRAPLFRRLPMPLWLAFAAIAVTLFMALVTPLPASVYLTIIGAVLLWTSIIALVVSSIRRKRLKAWAVLASTSLAVLIIGVANIPRNAPAGKAISAAENADLWAEAHIALTQFIGEGLKWFAESEARPATREELTPLSQSIDDFKQAVKVIESVTPPPEQVIMHRALLPVYQEMQGHMAGIRDALLSGDPWKANLEWHRLALLLGEAGGVSEILTLEPTPVPTATATPIPHQN